MQIAQPGAGPYLMPIAWYFAPPGAKKFSGFNAFTSGVWDPDKIVLPPIVGEQPPYETPYYNGANIWGYTGQCVVGTPQQFAEGLTAADLAATPAPVPTCCTPGVPGLFFFLRHDKIANPAVSPGGVVSYWDNQGATITQNQLSPLPGAKVGGPQFVQTPFGPQNEGICCVQYLSGPLPAQSLAAQEWLLQFGQKLIRTFPSTKHLLAALTLIDGTNGEDKVDIWGGVIFLEGIAVNYQPQHTFRLHIAGAAADVAFGDYLCLELGIVASAAFPPPGEIILQFLDSGTNPDGSVRNTNGNSLAFLACPAAQVDPDMPLSGTILPWAGPNVPAGYLACDGSTYSSSTYPQLFAAIGTSWGSGGSGTFNVPDLRDCTPIGVSPGGLSLGRPTPRSLGQMGGEEAHQLVTSELSGHTHGITDPGHRHTPGGGLASFAVTASVSGNYQLPSGTSVDYYTNTSTAPTGITITDSTGGNLPHNNMQPFAVVLWIIKT